MKKSLLLSMVLMFLLSFTTSAFATENFMDMPDDWSTVALEKSVVNGLLKGTNGKIMPRENLSRAQMAAVVERAFGAVDKASLDKFVDVSKTDWFYDSMAKAVSMKAFGGEGNKLRPNDNITREEAFVVLARSIKLSGASHDVLDKFYDKESISDWALDGLASMVEEGYITGAEGYINPKKYITRAEFAQVMDNILKNYISEAGKYTENLIGNVIIRVPNVTLSNMKINGDLIIADGVGDGDITLDGITVTGRTVIRGGGVNSIVIKGNSKLNSIIIARVDGKVRVYTEEGIEVGDIIADGSDDVIIEGYFDNVNVIAPDIVVTAINAHMDYAEVSGENSKIIVAEGSKANKIVLSSSNSSAEIAGTVKNIQTTSDAVNASIDTVSGAKVSKIDINGEGTSVTGKGSVSSVDANADNVDVTTPNTNVTAGKGTTGITAGGVELRSGQSANINNSGTGIKSPSYSKMQLTISDPVLTLSKDYDGNNSVNVTVGTLSGVKSGDTIDVTATAYYDTADVGTGKIITVEYEISGINVNDYNKPSNYVINTGEITKKQLTVINSVLTKEKNYDGNNMALVSVGDVSGIVGEDAVTVNAQAVYDTKNAGINKTITVEYSISGTDAANYMRPDDYVVTDGKINAIQLSISNTELSLTKEYDGNTNAEANVNGEILTGVLDGDNLTIEAVANYDNKNVGTSKTITVDYSISGNDAGNYIIPISYNTTEGVIMARQLSITEPSLTLTKVYDGNTTVEGTMGDLSGAVTGDILDVNMAANYDNKNAGTNKKITANYSIIGVDKDNYIAPADYIVNDGEITAKQLYVTAPNLTITKDYDGSKAANIIVGTMTGKIDDDNLILNYEALYDTKDVGTDKAITVTYTLSGADKDNYIAPSDYSVQTGVINKQQLSISDLAFDLTKVYDKTTAVSVNGYTINGVAGSEAVTLSAVGNYDNGNVDTNKTITIEYIMSGEDSSNYIKPEDKVFTNGVITPKPLSITDPSLTLTKVYDGSSAANMTLGTMTGQIDGDDLTLNYDSKYDTKDAGAGKTITVSYTIGGSDAPNYTAPTNYIVQTGEINKKQLTVSDLAISKSKVYDGTTAATVNDYNLVGLLQDESVTLDVTCNYDTKNVDANKSITVAFTVSGAASSNYIKPVDQIFTDGVITQKQLSVSAPSVTLTKSYDGSKAANMTLGNLTGKVVGDDLTVNYEALYDTKDAGIDKTITVTYTLSGADKDNYIAPSDYSVQTGVINKQQLSISDLAFDLTKVYDKTTAVSVNGYTINGVAGSEAVTLSAVGNYDNKNADTNKTITIKYTMSGEDSSNYIKPEDDVFANGVITAKPLLVNSYSLEMHKVYDGTTAVNVTQGIVTGVLEGDIVTVHTIANYDDKNIGSSKRITVAFISDGADKNNYSVPSDVKIYNCDITAKPLTIADPTIQKEKEYDGNTSAIVSPGALTGVVSGDTVNVNANANYNDSSVGTDKTITVVYTLSGIDAGNYIKPDDFLTYDGSIINGSQSAPLGLAGVNPTSSSNNDGKITGTTVDMEYKLSSNSEWISIEGTEITGLIPGTYNIRLKEKTGYDPSPATNVTVDQYISTLTSKSITKFNYTSTAATSPQIISNAVNSSDFSVSPVSFDIVDGQGNRIPVDLWWNITSDQGFTAAQLVGSGIESTIQDWFYKYKGGADGIMNRTIYAMGVGDSVTIGSFVSGSSASIHLYEPDTTTPYTSDLFTQNSSVGVDGINGSATFTISDGTKSATVLLSSNYADINAIVTRINSRITNAGVNATAVALGTDKFIIKGNNVTIDGTDKAVFFDTFITQ
ncbi:YDG domain-containing protein [Sedimentibacter saalensis]|uniref:YDG domain-containing protein n=1 Tax=Sedimentibacter saalensis TaxID=130788 RepID=UPI0028989662|nr:YDG domain-containing protein [Sedimentibacter saalensis]